MLEEIEMPVTLDLGIVGRVDIISTWVSKLATRDKIDLDSQALSVGIEVNALDIPRVRNTQSSLKDLVLHHYCPVKT